MAVSDLNGVQVLKPPQTWKTRVEPTGGGLNDTAAARVASIARRIDGSLANVCASWRAAALRM